MERLKSNPKLEAARARGIEVVLLTDPVDAFWTSLHLGYAGKPLKSLSHGEVNFGLVPLIDTGSTPTPAEPAPDSATVIEAVKGVLGERVSEVRASERLTDSAAASWPPGRAPTASSSGCSLARALACGSSRSSNSICAIHSPRPCRALRHRDASKT